MNLLRHLLALGIIAGFGYLYYQETFGPAPVELANQSTDPFAGWNHVDEAPAFQATDFAAETAPASETPSPIPFPADGRTDLVADLTNWDDTHTGMADRTSRSAPSAVSEKTGTPRNTSLWREPGTTDSPSSLPAQQPPPDAAGTTSSSSTGTPTDKPMYRQLALGVGNRKTVCVIDHTITEDGLLLSSLIAGLRREWSSNVDRSREQSLVLLMSDTQQYDAAEAKREVERVVRQIGPERLVHVALGQDTRGWLRFSSEEESIAALMSVPGVYRIKADHSLRTSAIGSDVPTIHLELPRDVTTQEHATVQLLSTALQGNWSEQQNLPYTGQALTSVPKPRSTPEELVETTSSFFKNMYENAIGSESSREITSPVSTPKNREETLISQFLGNPADFKALPEPANTKGEVVPAPATPQPVATPEGQGSPKVELLQPPPAYRPQPSRANGTTSNFFKLPPPPVKP